MREFRLRLACAITRQCARRNEARAAGDERSYESAGAALVMLDELDEEALAESLRPVLRRVRREVRR